MQLLLRPEDNGSVNLDPKLPSLAEVLASLASDTLVLASKDAPFVEFFVSVMTGPKGHLLTLSELHSASWFKFAQ
jgi:hypothetical protein